MINANVRHNPDPNPTLTYPNPNLNLYPYPTLTKNPNPNPSFNPYPTRTKHPNPNPNFNPYPTRTKNTINTLILTLCCRRYYRRSNCRWSKCRITLKNINLFGSLFPFFLDSSRVNFSITGCPDCFLQIQIRAFPAEMAFEDGAHLTFGEIGHLTQVTRQRRT